MTYYIGYTPKDEQNTRGFVMFDIEYYQKQSERNREEWYSEISCFPCVNGITHFLKDNFVKKDFDYEEFIRDAEEIEEVRGLLNERCDNRPKPSREADNFHYHVFGKRIEELFNRFAEKYGLWINRD